MDDQHNGETSRRPQYPPIDIPHASAERRSMERHSLERHPTAVISPIRARGDTVHHSSSLSTTHRVQSGPSAAEGVAAHHRVRANTANQAYPLSLDGVDPIRRRATAGSRRRYGSLGQNGVHLMPVVTHSSQGLPSGFSLAGPQNAGPAHQPYVDPGYTDLNPEYEQPQNARPVWGLAKPMPRVLRPGMVPTKSEIKERRQEQHATATEERKRRASRHASIDLEQGTIPSSQLRRTSTLVSQLSNIREAREEQLLQKYGNAFLQNHMSRRRSSRRRSTSASSRPAVAQPVLESVLEPVLSPVLEPVLEPVPERVMSPLPPLNEEEGDLEESHMPMPFPTLTSTSGVPPDALPHRRYAHVTGQDPIPHDWQYPEHPLHQVETASQATTEVGDEDDVIPLQAYIEDDEVHNNHTTWSVVRTKYREPLAEFLAVVVQLTFGFCADLSATTGRNSSGVVTPFAWGFATMIGIYIAGGISGAHLNPAITLMLYIFRGFPKSKIPGYIIAQILGAFVAGLIAFGLYRVDIIEYAGTATPNPLSSTGGAIADSFITSLRYEWIDPVTAFFNEFVATAFLVITVLALGDDANAPPGAGMNALIVGFVITCQCLCFAYNTGAALNPSRDIGPRLALLALGFGGRELFLGRQWFWLYGPWAACISGAMIGAVAYDVCIFTGGESPINYPRGNVKRAWRKTKKRWGKRIQRTEKSVDGKKDDA